eukprot:TRINITY_DN14796_c0_g1_i1.p1 TRINITY_DN14796_c0_g1~~TRINITY_DN14796_c0_g1_i1.p1  ORF type:complete len:562 (-),score=113.78 TRINITY_DN14796_c0_g1_i1:360-2045(-)
MKNRAIVKQEEGSDRFTFSFVFSGNPESPGRQFNMNRALDEAADQFIGRIQSNVEKILNKKKKKKEAEVKVDVKFVNDNGTISGDNITAEDLVKSKNLKMLVNETEYELVVNPPLVEDAKIAEPLMAGYPANPVKMEQKFTTDSKYDWYISLDPVTVCTPKKPRVEDLSPTKWKHKAEGFFYTPENSDIGAHLRLDVTPFAGDTKGDTFTVISSSEVEAGPDISATKARQAWTPGITEFPVFRVMSYNILADLYADSDFSRTNLFPQCPRFAMDYNYRVRLILNEVANFYPDILCFQENDRKVFKHDFKPVLEKAGFNGEFNKKGGQVDEGLSIFYRTTKFKIIESKGFVFHEVLETRYKHLMQKLNKDLKERLLARTTAVQLMALQSTQDEKQIIIVGNTHLFFKPDADHIRLLQTDMCLTELRLFRDEIMKANPDKTVATLFCGDFNSTPPFGVLQYCREGRISEGHPDWSSCPGEEVTGLSISHPFSLDSAAGTPQYTNYTVGFKDCLDYIFYDTINFDVEQVVPFPTEDELALNTALPNASFPSDHISVVVDLKWKQ